MPSILKMSNLTGSYTGVTQIFQFTNDDGLNQDTACGQAALATVLAFQGAVPENIDSMREVEKKYPADVLWGLFGTSPGRMRQALTDYHGSPTNVVGKEGLKAAMRDKAPVIILIQNTPGLGGLTDGAHWFVVFGCDDGGVYVTNYAPDVWLAWDDFIAKWTATVPNMVGMSGVGIRCNRITDLPTSPKGSKYA